MKMKNREIFDRCIFWWILQMSNHHDRDPCGQQYREPAKLVIWIHIWNEWKIKQWYFFSKIVLIYWEKKIALFTKLWNSRLKAKNLQTFWNHWNNLFKQWKVRTVLETEVLGVYCFGLWKTVNVFPFKVHALWEGHKIESHLVLILLICGLSECLKFRNVPRPLFLPGKGVL